MSTITTTKTATTRDEHNPNQQQAYVDYAHTRGRRQEHTRTCHESGKCIQAGELLDAPPPEHDAGLRDDEQPQRLSIAELPAKSWQRRIDRNLPS